jgi:hypothetical protein
MHLSARISSRLNAFGQNLLTYPVGCEAATIRSSLVQSYQVQMPGVRQNDFFL